MDLSRDILLYSKFSKENLLAIVDTLKDMKVIIEGYKADAFDAYVGFALSSARNLQTLIDQAKLSCGMELILLDNSRQRFIEYKALCSMENFKELVEESKVK